MEHAVHHPILATLFQLMALRLDQPNQRHLTLEAFQFGFGDAGHRVSPKSCQEGKAETTRRQYTTNSSIYNKKW